LCAVRCGKQRAGRPPLSCRNDLLPGLRAAMGLRDAAGRALAGDPIAQTLRLLRDGRIVAIKGLGGFHLACDARQAAAVARLRVRKQREAKPFAVMGLNGASLSGLARIGEAESALLHSMAAPVVLCPKGDLELPGIAPGLAWLGAMLPATPLHLLLWHEAAGRPAGTDWLKEPSELLLVMTSANPHGEPLVIANDERWCAWPASPTPSCCTTAISSSAAMIRWCGRRRKGRPSFAAPGATCRCRSPWPRMGRRCWRWALT
jgi:tRNA A37 threonylcarbamoyladenosine synthetase subunit TsaC/SUA5/YrdC